MLTNEIDAKGHSQRRNKQCSVVRIGSFVGPLRYEQRDSFATGPNPPPVEFKLNITQAVIGNLISGEWNFEPLIHFESLSLTEPQAHNV